MRNTRPVEMHRCPVTEAPCMTFDAAGVLLAKEQHKAPTVVPAPSGVTFCPHCDAWHLEYP